MNQRAQLPTQKLDKRFEDPYLEVKKQETVGQYRYKNCSETGHYVTSTLLIAKINSSIFSPSGVEFCVLAYATFNFCFIPEIKL